ncbi:MAG TPA: GNAT family N-acetyltransferase [Thermoplasmata archaeon]|jgi:ribosomal protein S18 acetylase RimI-like enzyme
MAIRIRPLRISDYDPVLGVLMAAGLEPRVRGRDSRREFVKQLRSNRTLYLGAFDGSRLVGTVFGTHDTRKGWINRLAVLPAYRRHGIAAKLVRACERGLRTGGLEIFAALVEANNDASQRLFTRLGYETTDIRYFRRRLRDEV